MSFLFDPIVVFRRNRRTASAPSPRLETLALSKSTGVVRRRWFAFIGAILAAPMAVGGWALGLHVMGNIHVVEPNALYRSAQLTGPDLDALIGQYGIRTIINLRGDNKGSSWYDDEIATSEKRSVAHVDVRMSARSEPSPSTLNDLISAMRIAPRPILIHCKDGADRTGLAAAIYELLIVGRGSDAAGRQLSFRYGHFPWLGSPTSAMGQAFESLIAETKSVAPAGAQ